MILNICLWVLLFSSCVHCVKDVVFVVDKSASLSQEDFNEAVDFIYNVTNFLTVGPHNTQFSVVTFSSDVTERFDLNDHQTSTSLLSAVEGLKSITTSGSTYTYDALTFVRTSSFSSTKGARSHAEKTVIILTDGQSVNYQKTSTEAQLLKDSLSAKIFSIAIGSSLSASNPELLNMSSDPDSYYSHHTDSYLSLCSLVPTLVPKLDPSVDVEDIPGCPSSEAQTATSPEDNTVVVASVATVAAVSGLGLTALAATLIEKKIRGSKTGPAGPEEAATQQYGNQDNRSGANRAVFDTNSLNDPSARQVPMDNS